MTKGFLKHSQLAMKSQLGIYMHETEGEQYTFI